MIDNTLGWIMLAIFVGFPLATVVWALAAIPVYLLTGVDLFDLPHTL